MSATGWAGTWCRVMWTASARCCEWPTREDARLLDLQVPAEVARVSVPARLDHGGRREPHGQRHAGPRHDPDLPDSVYFRAHDPGRAPARRPGAPGGGHHREVRAGPPPKPCNVKVKAEPGTFKSFSLFTFHVSRNRECHDDVRHHRAGDRGSAQRQDRHRGRRRGPRERGRPRLRGRAGHARDDQLHDPARPGPHLPGADRRALRPARPAPDDRAEHRGARHRLHRQHRRRAPLRRHHRHLGQRPRHHDPRRHQPGHRPVRPPPPGSHLPAPRPPWRRAAARRADRGQRGPRAARRAHSRRRHLRDPQRRRLHGAAPRAAGDRAAAQPHLRHRGAAGRLPAPHRAAGPPRGRSAGAHRVRRVPDHRLPERRGSRGARRAGVRRDRRAAQHPGPDALEVPDRRRVRLPALRLRLPAPPRHGADRAGGPRRHRLPRPGRPRHRPAEQAAGVRASGFRRRHGAGQRAARLRARPPELRHRRADPARPRPLLHPGHDQQPPQAGRPRRLRTRRSSSGCRCSPIPTRENRGYLQVKRDKLGHLLSH